jgi:aminoglycoside phosphotransferase (APT) family kinase protein
MPYGYDAAHEIVWQEMLPGISFAKETSMTRLADVAAPVADALAAFHAAPLVLPAGLGLAHELQELAASTAKIARAYPQHAARCNALERRLVHAVADLEPVPAAPVHGSFKTSHMFDAGGRVAFIDFDGAGIGDPTYDVGRFMAHLAVTALDAADGAAMDLAYERFRDSYARRAPWGWAERRVRWYTAALLLSSQAYKCVKRMAPERVAAILACAEAWFPEH